MTLPKIDYPLVEITIPSSGKRRLFRPFLAKEEKILLIAKASESRTDIFRAIKQVITNCNINDPSFDVDQLPIFDIEYIFLQLRAASVSNIIAVSYKDLEDEQVYDFRIDVNKIVVKFPENVNKKIAITPKIGVIMKYPNGSIYGDEGFLAQSVEQQPIDLIIRSIDKIYDDQTLYDPAEYTQEELIEFLDRCNIAAFREIETFLASMPTVFYQIEYKNSLGHDRTITLDTLEDFFTLR